MRFSAVAALTIVCSAGLAGADDPRDVFGLGKRKPTEADATKPADPRDVFGLGKRKQEPPLDCSDGLAFGCVQATDPLDDGVPYALGTWLPASYLLKLPVADATHDQVAHYALGVTRDEAGVVVGGATGLESRWTIEGAPADLLRTGGVETRVPLAFLDGIFVTTGGFAARDIASSGGTIDARLKRGTAKHELETRAFASWTAPARHRPILPATYSIRRGVLETGPSFSASVVATGPLASLAGGKAWYAAGLAPQLGWLDFTFTAGRLVDRDDDGRPDGLPGVVTTEGALVTEHAARVWSVPFMSRVGFDRGVHSLELTLVGDVHRDAFYLFNSTLQAAGVDHTTFVGDGIATWRGRWKQVRARVQLAWHRSMRRDTAADRNAAQIPQLLSAYVPAMLPGDEQLSALCADDVMEDPYKQIVNCPVPGGWFASGGAGPLLDVTGDRPSLRADLAHRFGPNVVRVGLAGEDSRVVTETRFTGGVQIRSLFPGHESQRRFVDPNGLCPTDPLMPCAYADSSRVTIRTRYTAAYVEDTWTPEPNLTVDGGVRWELMWVGPVLHFSNELAPRLGVTWDPAGNGRSRVWTTMGRTHMILPVGVGEALLPGVRTVDDATSVFGRSRSVDVASVLRVVPGVKPLAQDELTLGADVALARTLRLTAWLQGRWLARGLETTRDGLDNPGRNGDPPASRETGLFAVALQTAPTAKLALRTGYHYARTFGTWVGPFDPREGATLLAGGDYDLAAYDTLLGRLPTDAGHRFFVEAQRRGSTRSVKLAISARLTVGSGRARNVLASSDAGIIQLLPRGSAGRGPLVTQANVRLEAEWRRFFLTLDVFNAFDRRDATNRDEIYVSGAIRPISGGDESDLIFLKNEFGSLPTRRTSYGAATTFQNPLAVALGVHRSF